jgi:endonuclease/exonuclease/phosphatase family metal-dependent hydrolase
MDIIKKILKFILVLLALFVLCFAGMIVYALISDYKPAEKIVISENGSVAALPDSADITLLTWNIGYCGLDNKMDFFYDGGKKVFTPKENCVANLAAAERFITGNDSIDFIFIQEIDKAGKRSYNINEYDSLKKQMASHRGFFATNYDVFFVPLPPKSPMGKVYSGLATFSKQVPASSVRFAFPGQYGFPKQLFMLDRCFLVNRYPLAGGKELLIINTHNEAFDKGNIRKAQMAYLKEFILKEFSKGNYVITGGDWNQTPPDFNPEFAANTPDSTNMVIPSDFLPAGWQWLYDNTNPSERSVVTAYDPKTTPTTIFDFFLISPNIEAVSVKCVNLNFENSDHNPVIIRVRLKNQETTSGFIVPQKANRELRFSES